MSYKKRDIGGWNQGKACKGTRKAKEREFIKQDVDQQIVEQNDDYRVKYKGKRNKNIKARLEHRIKWYQSIIDRYKKMNIKSSMLVSWMYKDLERDRKKLKEMNDK